ncbi:MAG: thioredoxin domain-containing protein [Spirochaetia bacterium]
MNRLATQKSPYLLRHAGNPVDWYPWGEEAFEAARQNDKPLFLSIGYSTCHWCHVMESESFADPGVAALMNEAFVSIKVDREERPDLDEHFMNVSRLLTGTGGWPLSILLTADGRAFYAATYIPRENTYGRMGMRELVPRIRDLWQNRREEVVRSADAIATGIGKIDRRAAQGFVVGPGAAVGAARALAGMFDSRHGGFGGAPKFPMPTLIGLLLRSWRRDGDAETLGMVERTLAAMRSGGIYDQVGFGFHRYSVDEQWLVPHFEKMLYDQALHCLAFTEAWQATGVEAWKETAKEICAYVRRDLALPEGAFATAEDADSEGVEGKFYVWTESELRSLLGSRADDFCARYGIDAAGPNILHRPISDRMPAGEAEAILLAARARRTRPFRDDKILADWNGLMIAALARAGRAFGEPSLVEAAGAAARFVTRRMRRADGGLFHTHRDGESAIAGFADDYAFLAWGALELYEATFDATWLEECIALTEYLLLHFWDPESGGFFSTTEGSEVPRRKPFADGVIPSANSAATLLLLTLNRMTGRRDYQEKAEQLFSLYPRTASADPISFSFFLAAADFAAGPGCEVVVAGDPAAPDAEEMIRALHRSYLPNAVLLLKQSDAAGQLIVRLAPFTSTVRTVNGKCAAYVCRDFTCSLPTDDIAAMLAEVKRI